MKRFLAIVVSALIIIGLCSCQSKPAKQEITLTDSDMVYVDAVYKAIEHWDVSVFNSGQNWTVDKIAFYDFDGTNNLCFYKLYPVTDIYGTGYFVDKDGMHDMQFSVYDTNEKSRSMGWAARTRATGLDWNSNATKEEKYKVLKDAFLYYKTH